MLTTTLQHFLLSKGLNLKEAVLLIALKSLSQPIKMTTIIKLYPLLEIKERQYYGMVDKLEKANLLVKFTSSPKGLTFLFPFITPAKKCRYTPYYTCKKLQVNNRYICKKLQVSADIVNNNNKYKNNIYNLHYVVDIASGVVKNNISKAEVSLHKQIKKTFKKAFPEKNNFIKDQLPNNFDISLLISKINESEFLKSRKFVNLNWCIKNYDAIISGYYKSYVEDKLSSPKPPAQDFQQREYTREELNGLFDSLDDL